MTYVDQFNITRIQIFTQGKFLRKKAEEHFISVSYLCILIYFNDLC